MHTEDVILFTKDLPSSEEILSKIREISGLPDINMRNQNDKFEILEHPIFSDQNKFVIIREGNSIVFMRGWNDRNYLLEIAVSALIELGGSYSGELENWTREKWVKVKHHY